MSKARRQQLIKKIVNSRSVSTQFELQKELNKQGVAVTQATISRDIKELGLTKSHDINGQTVFRVQEKPIVEPAEKLRRMLAEFAISADSSGNLVVVKTTPGAAQTLARYLDQANLEELLGTVAGDDTILLIARDAKKGKIVERKLSAMLK